jgi:hypothetical protein
MAGKPSKSSTSNAAASGGTRCTPAGVEIINGLQINYGGCSVPTVVSRVYKYTSFDRTLVIMTDGNQQNIVVLDKIKPAWALVWKRAEHPTCNKYFKTLVKGKTLKEVLQEGLVTLHYLAPKDDKSYDKLPAANTAGRDIAINPVYLLDTDPEPLACTLIHELAHVAGATTNTRDEHAADAENALLSCMCKKHHDPQNLGSIQRLTSYSRYA